jgi:3',5'-cyclic AMP phosphodiesterase CpdA
MVLASRVLVVSDSHLSVRAPEANANWMAAVASADGFELVIHVGDLTLDGAHEPADLVHARRLLDALPIPWVVVPGNHDIGDNPGISDGAVIDGERRDRWIDRIGPDRWTVEIGGWLATGVNAQLFGSGLDAEAEQWSWLEGSVVAQGADRPVLLVIHKPLAAPLSELATAPPYRFVPEPARSRLTALLSTFCCPLVLSGHVHQYRTLDQGERRHLWAPTTWAVLPEVMQSTVGLKRCGVVSLELAPDFTASAQLVEPPELAQFTLAQGVQNPYQ